MPEPALEDLRLDQVFAALADPLRLAIVHKLMHEAGNQARPVNWFRFEQPKSTLSHHSKVLREAGLVCQCQHGVERRSALRRTELNARFPVAEAG